jgi:hypothetical protein
MGSRISVNVVLLLLVTIFTKHISFAFHDNILLVIAGPGRQPQFTRRFSGMEPLCASLPGQVASDETATLSCKDEGKYCPRAHVSKKNMKVRVDARYVHPKQIMKKLDYCGNNCTAALEILYTAQPFLRDLPYNANQAATGNVGSFDSKPICRVMNILSKKNQHSAALGLLNDVIEQHNANRIPTYYLKAVFKSMMGIIATQEQKQKQNLHRQIIKYIYHDIPYNTNVAPTIDIYHIALSALGKCRQIDSMMELLNELESKKLIEISQTANHSCLKYNLPAPDRMAYLAALTGTIRCKASHLSIEIMDRMIKQGMKPDKVVYNHVISSLANTKSVGRYEMAKKIWEEMERNNVCSDATYKSLIRLFSKENQWSDVADVRTRLGSLSKTTERDVTSANPVTAAMTPRYLEDLEKLQKMNKTKKSWYKLGRIQMGDGFEIIFGIQTHRNPILNGLSLVFYTPTGEKLGFILIRNQVKKNPKRNGESLFYSSILGMLVDENYRGKGLAKIFMGVWLRICVNSGAFPRSEKINKPLLSLVLTNFGFIPVSDSAVKIVINPITAQQNENMNDLPWKPQFSLYSKSPLNFGERELRIQKMIVSKSPPNPLGKQTAVRTEFEHPMTQKAQLGETYEKEANELNKLIARILGDDVKPADSFVNSGSHNANVDYRRERSTSDGKSIDVELEKDTKYDSDIQTQFEFFIDDDRFLKRVVFGYLF